MTFASSLEEDRRGKERSGLREKLVMCSSGIDYKKKNRSSHTASVGDKYGDVTGNRVLKEAR